MPPLKSDIKYVLQAELPLHAFMSCNFREVRSLDPQKGRFSDSTKDNIRKYCSDILIVVYDYRY